MHQARYGSKTEFERGLNPSQQTGLLANLTSGRSASVSRAQSGGRRGSLLSGTQIDLASRLKGEFSPSPSGSFTSSSTSYVPEPIEPPIERFMNCECPLPPSLSVIPPPRTFPHPLSPLSPHQSALTESRRSGRDPIVRSWRPVERLSKARRHYRHAQREGIRSC